MSDGMKVEARTVGKLVKVDLDASPGVHEILGPNGAGKSTLLAGLRAWMTGESPKGDERPTPTDGFSSGSIEGLGRRLTIGARFRVTGELEVATLAADVDPGKLSHPGIADPVAADRARLKVLLRMRGAIARPGDFAQALEQVGVDPTGLLNPKDMTTDAVDLAAAYRRACLQRAADAKKDAGEARARSESLRASVADLDLEAESDEAVLAREAQEAVRAAERARGQVEARRTAAERAQAARERLDALGPAPDVAAATEEVRQAAFAVEALRESLRAAEERERAAQAKLETVTRAADDRAEWEATLAASVPEAPSEEDVAALEEGERVAQMAVAHGAEIRRARKVLADAESESLTAAEQEVEEAAWRTAADRVADVLTRVLEESGGGSTRWHLVGDRLCVPTERSPSEVYGGLSDGQRTEMALDEGYAALPDGGVMTVDQVAWQHLDEDARMREAERAVKHGVCIWAGRHRPAKEGPVEVVTVPVQGGGGGPAIIE